MRYRAEPLDCPAMTTFWTPGDIGVTTGPDFVSRLIQFGQHIHGDAYWKWNHAFIVVDSQGGTIEAQGAGVVHSNVSTHGEMLNLGCPDGVDRLKVVGYAVSRVKTKYSYPDVVLMGIDCLTHARLSWGGGVICSQLAAECLMEGGWQGLKQDAADTMPADLVDQMQPISLLRP
jgi:hypothetical protein